mmetsp:Transcript_32462/g.60389  ORF Transcript_32462/g.60389 Transcript_32462/m.60389 type:complete len:243 (+) Transcript_32462:343-1071(+)
MCETVKAMSHSIIGSSSGLSVGCSLLLFLDRQEELELRRQLLFGVETVREVNPPYTAVGMDLDSECLNVIRSVSPSREIAEVELDLVPAFVKTHRHSADERFHARGRLVVRCTESPADILVVQDLHFERKVLFQVFDDHHKERKLDAKRLICVGGTRNVVRANIGANNLQDARLDVVVGNALNVSVSDFLVPQLQRLAPDTVENRQESRLVGVFEHCFCRRELRLGCGFSTVELWGGTKPGL